MSRLESSSPTTGSSKRPWRAAALWPLVVLLFLPCCFATSGLYMTVGTDLNVADPWLNLFWLLWLLPAAPVFFTMGRLQQRILKANELPTASGWAMRTMVGAVAGLFAYVLVLWLLREFYYAGPLVRSGGIFVIQGDPVEVGVTVGGWGLAGLVLGLVQWRPRSLSASDMMPAFGWAIASGVGWGAGAVTNWTLFKLFVIGYEPICIDCLLLFVGDTLIAASAIGLAGGLALLSRPLSIATSLLVCAVAALLVVGAPQPVFSPREIHPYLVLDPKHLFSYPYVESVAFSDDGQVLAAVKSEMSMGEITGARILLWRTSDWQPIGSLENGQKTANIQWDLWTPLVVAAETTDGRSNVSIRQSNGRVLHTVVFGPTHGKLPQGFSFSAPTGLERVGQLSTPSGQVMVMSADPVQSWISPNKMTFDYSPDGRYIAAGYEYGGIWVWKLP